MFRVLSHPRNPCGSTSCRSVLYYVRLPLTGSNQIVPQRERFLVIVLILLRPTNSLLKSIFWDGCSEVQHGLGVKTSTERGKVLIGQLLDFRIFRRPDCLLMAYEIRNGFGHQHLLSCSQGIKSPHNIPSHSLLKLLAIALYYLVQSSVRDANLLESEPLFQAKMYLSTPLMLLMPILAVASVVPNEPGTFFFNI